MINPIGMTAVEWTDQMALLLRVSTMRIDREEDWRVWARHVLQSSAISRYNPPQPDQFDDWKEWADRFNQTVPVVN